MLLVLVILIWNGKSATKIGRFWSKRGMADVLKPEHPVVCLRFTTFHGRASMTWGKGIWSSFIIWLGSDIPKREPRLWCWVVVLVWKKGRLLSFCDFYFCGFMAVLFSVWAKHEARCQISFRMKNVMSLETDFPAKQIENKTKDRLNILQNPHGYNKG